MKLEFIFSSMVDSSPCIHKAVYSSLSTSEKACGYVVAAHFILFSVVGTVLESLCYNLLLMVIESDL